MALTADQIKNIQDYAQRSANTFTAGVSPAEIQQQYQKDLATLPADVRQEAEKIFATELETNRPDALASFRQATAPQSINLTQTGGSTVTGVGAGSTPGVTTGFNAPTTFTPEQYQSYAESLKGMDPFNIKNKVLEDRARLESQGYTLPSDTINQYLEPVFQSSIKEFAGAGPTSTVVGGPVNNIAIPQPGGSSVSLASGPTTVTGFNAPTGPTLGGPTQTLDLAQTGGSPVTTGVDTTGITVQPSMPLVDGTAGTSGIDMTQPIASPVTVATGTAGVTVPTAPPAPPPVVLPEVADITIADTAGNPVTYQYGSQINDALA